MRLFAPVADHTAVLARRNPLAKLSALFVVSFGLLAATGPVAPAVVLAVELATVPLFGMRYRALPRRCWPLVAAALGMAAGQLLFGADTGGHVLWRAGPLVVTEPGLTAAMGLGLRVLAVALPGILVFASTDPTRLADALVQQARVPARFAIGALAAFRLLPLLADEWQTLVRARRARGIDAGARPHARIALFVSTMFALLVSAIRRGTRLAVAMDARGFDSGVPRTHARPQRFTLGDGALVAASLALLALALTATTPGIA